MRTLIMDSTLTKYFHVDQDSQQWNIQTAHVLQLQGMDNETSYFMPHVFVGEAFTVVQMCPNLLKLIVLNLKKKVLYNEFISIKI